MDQMLQGNIFARIKEDRQRDADQLARMTSGRLKFTELRDGRWMDISQEVADELKRRIFEADALLQALQAG